MRLPLLFALALCVGTGAVSITVAADSTPASSKGTCCNDTCPIDGKAVDKSIKTSAYHPVSGPKTPDMVVGFCSDDCRSAYEKDPARYDATINEQIQRHRQLANPKSN